MYTGPFTPYEAAHLLRRAAARGKREEAEALADAGLEGAVERLLQPPAPAPEPAFELDPKTNRGQVHRALVKHWLRHWLTTPTPAAERLVLFWSGHFTSEFRKVKLGSLVWRQNQTFRTLGPGRFPELLEAVARDPAMLVYLDNATSRKEHPNENWGRELLELFTLGEGQYDEADVQAAARAFTGWSITPPRKARAEGRPIGFEFRARWHDDEPKTFLGQTVRGGEEVLQILARHPRTYRFLAGKFLRFYLAPDPPAELVERGAEVLQLEGSYGLLRWLFTHAAFYAPEVRNALVKSPVEYLIGLLYVGKAVPERLLARALVGMGQVPFQPPNVAGWPRGEAWLGDAALLVRLNLLPAVLEEESDLSVFMDGAEDAYAAVLPQGQML
ncbi:protein of unknown function DUF1800 [Oceanithermus profundus DSM 14977]|uniref:DUF1800 domain-containing protein n=1 Tax=Oceanithermus profundus (strain DSM 14977 / NBRC 100410 / VKM B-2274 / 506) TaxID=670487 RepID=E4U7N8_OCEP5|nr:DUF1800 domain-containing protein [Oceanithermus profundus]ADR36487.1 protein of unknown function DUF1800 [Oceanithermus profundus DSM 14977]